MIFKVVSVAIWAAVCAVTVADAQTLGRIGGPAEQPPSGFKGQMFVDSRGCVFLRAGYGGTTNWVARVNRDRKPLCGYPATMATLGKAVPTVEDPAVRPTVRVVAAPAKPMFSGKPPMETVASAMVAPTRMAPAPVVAQSYAAKPVVMPQRVVPGPNQIGCYTSAPVPQIVALASGGHAVMCTRGDGTLIGMRAPLYAKVAMGEGNRVGAGLYNTPGGVASRGAISATQLGSVQMATTLQIQIPKGYKAAWTDDRLNPYRAQGTAQGQAQQDQVWTRDVPARLVADVQVAKTRLVVASQSAVQKRQVITSTMTAPRAVVAKQASAGTFYIQVGTFGVAANAEGTKARVRAAGLPIGTSNITKGGKALQIVFAGPFNDSGSAVSALGALRGAGFADAFIR